MSHQCGVLYCVLYTPRLWACCIVQLFQCPCDGTICFLTIDGCQLPLHRLISMFRSIVVVSTMYICQMSRGAIMFLILDFLGTSEQSMYHVSREPLFCLLGQIWSPLLIIERTLNNRKLSALRPMHMGSSYMLNISTLNVYTCSQNVLIEWCCFPLPPPLEY